MPAPRRFSYGSIYRNPFRRARATGERIDMGVDYSAPPGDPIYAIGPGVVDAVYPLGGSSGWPGGGWVSYRLTAGPEAGHRVYVAEDISPTVRAGQSVTSGTVIARFAAGTSGIETGWAGPNGTQPLAAYLGEANPAGDPGRYSTVSGVTFSNLIAALGGPAGVVQPGGIRGPGLRIVDVPVSRTSPGGPTPPRAPVQAPAGGRPPVVVFAVAAGLLLGAFALALLAASGVAAGTVWAAKKVTE